MRKLLCSSVLVAAVVGLLVFFYMLPITGNSVDDPPSVTESITPPTEQTTPPTIPHETIPKPDTQEPQYKTHVLTFVGDCTLGTMPDWMQYDGCFTEVIKDNYNHPFNAVRKYFESDDCTFINLESVFANDGTPEDKQFTFRGPTDYVQILTGSSVEVANLSNNHTFDFGQDGYDSTVQVLEKNCIRYIGRNDIAVYTTQSGLTIGMYGVYFDLNTKDMEADIQRLQAMGADIIVAACHWGIEREYQPNGTQKNIAYKLIDSGVDIVWGHHPHVLQPIEEYNGGIIYYSLGNFSFGGNHNPSDKDTVVLQQRIIEHADGTVEVAECTPIPCRLSSVDTYNDFQPTPYAVHEEGYQRTLDKLQMNINETPQDAPEPEKNPEQDKTPPDDKKPSHKPTEPPKDNKEPELTVDEKVKNGTYMLRRSFGFYRGTRDMNDITKIVITREKPASYDEKWYANLAQTSDIMGYRHGTTVYIVGEHIYANTYAGYMFARLNSYEDTLWSSLQKVEGLELLNMSYCERTDAMFYEQKWTEITGIGDWDMSNIESLNTMFGRCTELTTLDIGRWDVSHVKNFNGLFSGSSWAGDMKFTYLPLENWDTRSATKMSHMFYGCAQLEYIPLENWDVSHVTEFSHTFADCYKLNNLDFSKWDTSSVTNFDAFLNDCRALVTIDVSGLDTENCKQFSQMFEACTNLEEIIGIDTWDVSSASKAAFQQMFHCCYKLKKLDVPNWVGTPDDIARMFAHCRELEYVNISGLDLSKLTWVQEAFWDCPMLKEIVWKQEYDFSAIEGFDSMWNECNPDVKHTCLT